MMEYFSWSSTDSFHMGRGRGLRFALGPGKVVDVFLQRIAVCLVAESACARAQLIHEECSTRNKF
jgi:hypothetical protein